MLENHRVIRQSLNDAEWDLMLAFVRKLDTNDIWMRFGRPLDLQQDFILKQFFDIRVGLGEIVWSPDGPMPFRFKSERTTKPISASDEDTRMRCRRPAISPSP